MPKRLKSPYSRVMLKLSGEVLQGRGDGGVSKVAIESLCSQIGEVVDMGVQVGVVVGGGNFWRFRDHKYMKLNRVLSDYIGMTATVMNVMALHGTFAALGYESTPLSALAVPKVLETYSPQKGHDAFKRTPIVICAGGTGSPFFTTDSSAALRALELECDILLKATKVDYVYDKDPKKYKSAHKYVDITFQEVLSQGLGVMNLSAISLCKEGNVSIRVFNIQKKRNLIRVAQGEELGTLIH